MMTIKQVLITMMVFSFSTCFADIRPANPTNPPPGYSAGSNQALAPSNAPVSAKPPTIIDANGNLKIVNPESGNNNIIMPVPSPVNAPPPANMPEPQASDVQPGPVPAVSDQTSAAQGANQVLPTTGLAPGAQNQAPPLAGESLDRAAPTNMPPPTTTVPAANAVPTPEPANPPTNAPPSTVPTTNAPATTMNSDTNQ